MLRKMYVNKAKDVVYRIIESQAVILTPSDSHIHTLNTAGTFIWELLDGKRTIEEIIENICTEYNVEKKTAETDVNQFIEDILRRKLICIKN